MSILRNIVCICTLLLGLSCYASVSYASEITGRQESTISVPLKDWNRLKENLTTAESLMSNSNQSLIQAKALTDKQASELTELKSINKKQEIELTKAMGTINEQKNSLEIASTLSNELKQQIKRDKETEQRLKRQRNTWAFLGGILAVTAIIK